MQPRKDLPPQETDLLVDRAIEGDAESFGRLYDTHVDRIYRHVYYRVGNTADAQDLTQQVFTKAWQAIGRYRKTGTPFLAWLIRISHNLVIDFYRARKDSVNLDDAPELTGPGAGPERLAELNEEQKRIRKAIIKLPDEQQQVILMKFIEDFTYPEIAAALNKSEGAIRVIQFRALKRLRLVLEGEE